MKKLILPLFLSAIAIHASDTQSSSNNQVASRPELKTPDSSTESPDRRLHRLLFYVSTINLEKIKEYATPDIINRTRGYVCSYATPHEVSPLGLAQIMNEYDEKLLSSGVLPGNLHYQRILRQDSRAFSDLGQKHILEMIAILKAKGATLDCRKKMKNPEVKQLLDRGYWFNFIEKRT